MLKILCIHGYRQNAAVFRERLGALRKLLKKYADFVFMTAPHRIPSLEQNDAEYKEDQYGWWFSREDKYFKAQDRTDCHLGYEESLKTVEEKFKEDGPFDGILGFSQGGSLVSLLCGLQEQSELSYSFKFAILIAAFPSRSEYHQKCYASRIQLPTLIVYGDTDQVIEKEMSEELLEYFENCVALNHPGGHFIPANSQHKQTYVNFLNKFRSEL